MNKKTRRLVMTLVFVLTAGVLAPVTFAKEAFTLVKAVPEDVFLCVAGRHSAERDFLDAYWGDVFDALKQSGIGSDVMALIGSFLGEEQRAEVDRFKERATQLLDGVDWKAFGTGEIVFAQRLNKPVSIGDGIVMLPDLVWLMRGGSASGNYDGLVTILQAIVSEINKAAGKEMLAVERTMGQGAKIASLNLASMGPKAPSLSLAVALHGDVIVIAAGDGILKDVLGLLAGESPKKSLFASRRFTQAFAALPGAEDEIFFLDMQAMLKPIRALVEEIASDATAKWLAKRLLDVPAMIDYVASVEYTDGFAVYSEEIAVLVPGAADTPIYSVFGDRKPLENFDRYLPKETTSFSVSDGIDLKELYKFIEDTIRGMGRQGEEILAQWAGLQQQIGVDVRKDLLGLIQGGAIKITLQQPLGSAWVFMLKVTDQAVASAKIGSGVKFLATQVQQLAEKQPMLAMLAIRTTPATHEKLSGFQNVHIGMSPKPIVYGVADGYLIVGSSAEAVAMCLATAAGEHPSIRENRRLMADVLIPKGPFRSISFADKRNLGADIEKMIAIVSMGGGMATMAIPDPSTQRIVSKLLGIVRKLTPVVQKIDFYRSSAEYVTFDGKAWRTRRVMHYKSPAQRASRAGG